MKVKYNITGVLNLEKINRNNIPKNLYSITQLKEQGLKPLSKEAKYYTYNQYGKMYYLYDINETKKIKKRTLTEKQLKALEEGRRLRKVCKICNEEFNYVDELDGYKVCHKCNHIYNRFFQEYKEIRNIKLFTNFLENKDKYIILDTETTGIESNDQIIELSIIDLDGNILFDSLFKPSIEVSRNAESVHGLSNKILSNAPIWSEKWEEIKFILKDKIALIYNSPFDYNLIKQTCDAFNVEFVDFNVECLMRLYSDYIDSKRWVSLQRAYESEVGDITQSHRALGDCKMCLELINSIANRTVTIDKNIKDTAYNIVELRGELKYYENMFTRC